MSVVLLVVTGVALLSGVALIVTDWAGGVVVIGESAMPARTAAAGISSAGAVAAIVALTVRALRSKPDWALSLAASILLVANAAAVVIAVASWVPTLLVLRAPTFALMPEESANGCRALVAETSFLVAGEGRAYAVPATPLSIVYPQADWQTDDGAKPFSQGQGQVVWTSSTEAVIDGTDVLSDEPITIGCH